MLLRPLAALLLVLLGRGARGRAAGTPRPARRSWRPWWRPPRTARRARRWGTRFRFTTRGQPGGWADHRHLALAGPLQVELGKRQVIPGLEQSLLDMCVGEKRRVIIPPQLAYGKRGSPPAVPADAVLQFDVELFGLSRASYWQKLANDVLPLLCIGLIPALLGLIGYHLYHKASSSRGGKKRLKEEKRNKAKKK
ncbi:unnamed protein product [Natator depressus]